MKKIMLICLFLISTYSFAGNIFWRDLTVTRVYKLTQDITFDDGTVISRDKIFKLQDVSESNGGFYEFQEKPCLDPDKKASVSMFMVMQDSENPVYVVATLKKYCNLNLEIDRRDFNTFSPFDK